MPVKLLPRGNLNKQSHLEVSSRKLYCVKTKASETPSLELRILLEERTLAVHDYQWCDHNWREAPTSSHLVFAKKPWWWTAQGFEWAAPAIESHQGWVSIIRCIYMHGAQVWIHQPLPSRFLLFEIENQVKSYNPPNAGLPISLEVKWSSLHLISPDCYRGRC